MSKLTPMVAVGQVIKHRIWRDNRLVKVRLQRMSLDTNLLMYFPKQKDKWSVDIKNETKVGDIVVIRNLDETLGLDIYSKVDNILYQVGATVDPVTGRPCRGTEFLDEDRRKVEQSKRNVEDLRVKKTVEKAS
ncbi:28S ribosomal protein S17, mitochondrial-like [Mercenaria mercenaria]|uniref:28S ribosomal protein S17, mitochondrial-like n=1 Tax=Mercenaria mercenaria TaxID=6596 RepID=UPI00234EA55E|nr:28S ribosomal protein S17, mitochondrial-like [Mercenaria mercenaria]